MSQYQMTTQPEDSSRGGVTRRSFLQVAVGAIVTLPTVVGGFLMPDDSPLGPATALAAEEIPSTKVVVAKPYEAGFVVVDTLNQKMTPVPAFKVTITSHYNGKKLTGHTNASGLFLADIRDLAEKKTEGGVERYSFYGRIDIEKSGFRSCRMYRMSIEGAKGFQIPTCSIAPTDDVYPLSVSFDEWDILYTKNEFCVTSANDTKHVFRIELVSNDATPIKVSLCQGLNRKVLESATVTARGNVATATFQSFYLLTKHKSALEVGSTVYLRYEVSEVTHWVKLKMSLVSAPTGVTQPGTTNFTLSPFTAGAMTPTLEIPKWVPLLGGAAISVWTPDLPVEVVFNPFGYFKIAYRSEEKGYKSKNGKYEGNAWKSHPRKTFEDQANAAMKDREEAIKKVGQAIDNRSSTFESVSYTKSVSATAMLAGYLAGRWDITKALWRGQAAIVGTLAFNFSYSQQFLAGPIPMIFEFSFLASVSLSLEVALSTPEIFSASKYSLDYTNTGIGLTVFIQPAISLGVGIKGVASVAVKGMLAISIWVHAGPLPAGNAVLKPTNPHVVIGVTATISVVLQALIFTTSYPVLTRSEPAVVDNWKRAVSPQADGDHLADSGDAYETVLGGTADNPFEIVAEQSIAESSEYEISGDWDEVVGWDGDAEDTEVDALDTIYWDIFGEWGDQGPFDIDESDYLAFEDIDDDGEIESFVFDAGYDWLLDTLTDEDLESYYRAQAEGQGDLLLGTQASVDHDTTPEAIVTERIACVTDDGEPYEARVIRWGMAPRDTAEAPETADTPELLATEGEGTPEVQAGAMGEPARDAPQSASPVEGLPGEGLSVEDPCGATTEDADDASLASPVAEAVALTGQDAPAAQTVQPQEGDLGAAASDSAVAEPGSLGAQADDPKRDSRTRISGQAWESAKSVRMAPNAMRASGRQNGSREIGTGSISRTAVGYGLRTDCEGKYIENMFSDPRTKIVKIYKDTYIFRIASVKVRGKVRTRVVSQRFLPNGKYDGERVYDFSRLNIDPNSPAKTSGVSRDDLFDYDFDVAVGPYFQRMRVDVCNVHLFIISGRRPSADGTTIGQAASEQFFTYGRCCVMEDTNGPAGAGLEVAFSSVVSDSRFTVTSTPCEFHNFSCPHIEYVTDSWKAQSYDEGSGCIITYLDRGASTPEGVLKAGADASVGLGIFFVPRDTRKGFTVIDTKKLVGATIDDKSVFQMTTLDRIFVPAKGNGQSSGWTVVSMVGNQKSYHYAFNASMAGEVMNKGEGYLEHFAPRLKSIKQLDVAYTDGEGQKSEPTYLIKWPRHQALLASVAGKLMRANLTGLDGTDPSLTYRDCGPASFDVSSFGVDLTGTYVFWPTTAEGVPGYDYGNVTDDPSQATELPEVRRNQVMAARLRKERFSDPFVFCEVDHRMDSITVVGSAASEAMNFLFTEITDVKAAKANLWFISMPNARCINVVGITCIAPVVFPGREAEFDLVVRNDGNTYVKEFTACLRETGKKDDLSKAVVTFSAKTLMESAYNPKGPDGKLQNVEDDYALAPGKTAVYRVRITIPKGWSGEKQASVAAKNVVLASAGLKTQSLFAQADEDEGLVYDSEPYVEFDDSNSVEYVVAESEEVGDEDYDDGREPFDIVDVWYEDDLEVNTDGYDYDLEDAPILSDEEVSADEDKDDDGNNGSRGSGRSASDGPSYPAHPQGGAIFDNGAPRGRTVVPGRVGISRDTSSVIGNTGSSATSTSTTGTAPTSGATGSAAGTGGGAAGISDTGAGTATSASGAVANPVDGGARGTVGTSSNASAVGTAGTSVSQSSATPATGDDGVSHLPLGLALAGAGLIAYSRRRERIEREGAGQD